MEKVNNAPPPPEWMTINAIGAELDVARPTVEMWMSTGLPHYRLGPKLIRIKRSDLEAFLEERRIVRNRCSSSSDRRADSEDVAA